MVHERHSEWRHLLFRQLWYLRRRRLRLTSRRKQPVLRWRRRRKRILFCDDRHRLCRAVTAHVTSAHVAALDATIRSTGTTFEHGRANADR